MPSIRLWPLAAAAACLSVPAVAKPRVQDPILCTALPNPVFVTGSSAVQSLVDGLSPVLATAAEPITTVYVRDGSCVGVEALVKGTPLTKDGRYWDSQAGAFATCKGSSVAADIGVSDVFATSCQGIDGVPPTVGDFFGPVQVMNFVVPAASSKTSISAEAAYLTFGLGAAGETPWNDPNSLFVRNAGSGTQTMIGKAINVPAAAFKGKDAGGSDKVVNLVAAATDPERAIGLLASNEADANRQTLKILAYQHYGQTCGYWPDSSLSSTDKANVRIGRYPVWGPLHLLTPIDGERKPVKPAAAAVIDYITDRKPLTGVSLIDIQIGANVVPQCAMKVNRTEELGPLSSYSPEAPCGCYFDSKRKEGGSSCQACTSDTECTGVAKHCRLGFCEAR